MIGVGRRAPRAASSNGFPNDLLKERIMAANKMFNVFYKSINGEKPVQTKWWPTKQDALRN
jgi:hypothetical protein